MAIPPLVLSTCGTSILTNHADRAQSTLCIAHANARSPEDVPETERLPLEALIQRAADAMAQSREQQDDARAVRASAEFACLAAAGLREAQHVLVHTDTWLGKQTAQILAERLSGAELITFPGLQGKDAKDFREGASDLARWVATDLQARRAHGQRLVFNLTGGFKSLNGFLQTLGAVYADECVYVFERTASPVRVPRLPVTVDLVGAVAPHRLVVRRMALGDAVRQDETQQVPETLLVLIDGLAGLSVWGDAAWAELRDRWYREGLVEAPPGVAYGPRFERDARQHEARTFAINEVVEQLARWALSGRQPTRAHAIAPLMGDYAKAHAPSTHRVHVWPDGDPGRLLFHREGAQVVVDRLLRKSEVGQ